MAIKLIDVVKVINKLNEEESKISLKENDPFFKKLNKK